MIRSIKALGLLVTAALAIGAMSASAAQAQVNFTAGLTENILGEPEHTTTLVHGKQTGKETSEETGDIVTTNYLEANKQKVSCEDVKYYGEIAEGTQNDLTLTPIYKHCGITLEDKLNTPALVDMHECDYILTEPEHIIEEPYTFTGEVKLECTNPSQGPVVSLYAGGTITEPSILVCEVEVKPNQEFKHVVYENTDNGPAPDTINATVTVEGIEYENKKKTCPEGIGTHTDGKFHSNIDLTAGGTEGEETVSSEDDVWLSTTE